MDGLDEQIQLIEQQVERAHQEIEVMKSDIGQLLQEMMTLRRESLIQMLVNSDKEDAQSTRMKGRINEMDYWLSHISRLEEGVKMDIETLTQIDVVIAEQRFAEETEEKGYEL